MSAAIFYKRLFVLSFALLSLPGFGLSQVPSVSPTPPATASPDEEVVRIGTSLIQTGVSVSDKKGAFVKDLKPEDFELQVNGKPVAISFFEVVNGQISPTEIKVLGTSSINSASPSATAKPTVRGRTIIFVVDDVHLSADSTIE